MSKNHRGSGLYEKIRRGRGTCPVCRRTGVKLLYSHEVEGKKSIEICKICRAAIAHGKKTDALKSLS